MSISRQFARDLVRMYDHSLEQQIVKRGSSLACRDEELWMQVEGLLRDGDAKDKHCLGLDPLAVMEESLKATAACSRRGATRGELQGLAKAFEVLEQAALNLYLGPWRGEYRVIKMYSGTFSHCIAPVLPRPQIEKLFGLLGYQPSPSWPEQLCLQSRVSPAFLDDLLRLSCAFFVARCECCLLVTALGKHVGDSQWELSVVRERLKGNSLQVSLDNTKTTLETSPSGLVPADGDLDLYRDEQAKGEQKDVAVGDEEGPHFVDNALPSAAQPANESTTKGFPARSDGPDPLQIPARGLSQGEPGANHSCACLHSPLCLKHCLECNALHDITCAFVSGCEAEGHMMSLVSLENIKGLNEVPPSSGSIRETTSDALSSNGAPVTASPQHPIGFHDCCDLSRLDPQVLCRRCRVFHSGSCNEWKLCQTSHDVSHLGVCSCGKVCSRSPLVLCRYCGIEYCSNCWYKNPITCICGQTFDQSSSV